MIKIDKLLKFLNFSQKFRETQRHIYAVGENRMENDVEHSYQLALLAWFLIETEKLKLDKDLAIKYALIHDLEEVLTGDRYLFDKRGRANKEKVEEKARKKIKLMFPKWKDYKNLSKNYKLLSDNESRFVNGLDKIIPVLNIYLDDGKTWKREDTTLEMIVKNKRETVKVHSFSKKLWPKIEAKLKKRELELFGKPSKTRH